MKNILISLAMVGSTVLSFGGVATAATAPTQCSGQTSSVTVSTPRQVVNVKTDNTTVYVNSNSNVVNVSGKNDCVAVNSNSNSVKVTGDSDTVVINGNSNSVTANNAAGNDTVVDNGSRNSTTTNGTFEGNGTKGSYNHRSY